jgi:hypothetical protein
MWTVLAMALPGPWTPIIVLAYILGRTAERDQDTAHHQSPPPDPSTRVPVPASLNPYVPPQ